MEQYRQVFANNREWVAAKLNEDPNYFDELAKGQTPNFLYIGCADSRVPANEIMGLAPGDIFVHRNIANLVVNTDLNAQSVIEYAVVHLKVKHIIVCGHYGCGGVKGAMQPQDLGILNGWLREIRDVYRIHKKELDQIEDEEKRYRRLIELNVIEQCTNVLKIASVQKMYKKTGYPYVHGWVFDLHNGYLVDLNVDHDAVLHQIEEVYNLTV
ncbi:MAG TPA: carbonic anhydrase [Saprospiraceae bacterium]|nr:carbonic anhydrase [Saprospiraceae bacterium]MCB9272130.1 carbonic anhydrase [Lewinellaceae bacterium]HPG06485.1 carbonic anhydrase [Saprospiraceae bacterium]HPR00218.1 carbonic anhydrase [Saprospiraceae bacterium]HQU53117.1 carbonic anhydrase [Saprospiraceae bacterium]